MPLNEDELRMFVQSPTAPTQAVDDDPFSDLDEPKSQPQAAAVIPPDAPANSVDVAAPAPAKRGRKPKVIIHESDPDLPPVPPVVLTQGKQYDLPNGEQGTFNCVTNNEAKSFTTPTAKAVLVPTGVETPEAKQCCGSKVITIEFGPKTVALLMEFFRK